jgi:hypothetical protein
VDDAAVDISSRSSADARAACRPVEARTRRLSELPPEVADDAQLRANLAARYGTDLEALHFQLIEVPLTVLTEFRLDDFDEHFESLIESDREYDAIMLRCGEEPEWAWEDGEERRAIACEYLTAFRAGVPVRPIVVDFASMAAFGVVALIDGHHRTAAAHEAGARTIMAHEILAWRGRAGIRSKAGSAHGYRRRSLLPDEPIPRKTPGGG